LSALNNPNNLSYAEITDWWLIMIH